jgi:hypothetical protein
VILSDLTFSHTSGGTGTSGGRRSHLGWNIVSPGRKASSHRGHKTGVSVLDAMTEGKPRSKIMEWMLVTNEILVARYCEQEYIVAPFVSKMFDWMGLPG